MEKRIAFRIMIAIVLSFLALGFSKNPKHVKLMKPVGISKPDLKLASLQFQIKQEYVDFMNHKCRVFETEVIIANVGNRDVTIPFKIFLEWDTAPAGPDLNFERLKYYDVPGLAAGATIVLEPKKKADNCYWYVNNPTLSMRPRTRIRVTVDSDNAVSEIDENNNQTIHDFDNLY